MWIRIIQIFYEFVLIYDRQTQQQKLQSSENKASPLSPGTRECVCLVPKYLRHWRMQFETWAHTISLLYQNHQDTIRDPRLIRIHFHAISLYRWILNILSIRTTEHNLNFDTFYLMKYPSWPPPNPNTIGKLRLSAFQWYKNLGVMDRVFLTK